MPRISAALNSARYFLGHPVARRQPWRCLLRGLRWQAASRRRPALAMPWIEGTTLVVERGMTGATGNLYYGLHEFGEMAAVLHLLRPGELFVDVGANVGVYTVLASAVAKARTVAFEPDPGSGDALLRNVETNGIAASVVLHRCAVGDAARDVAFTDGLGTMNRVAAGGTRTVRMETLDSFSLAPTVVKLDIEGGELGALRGAAGMLARPSLLAIVTEGHGPEIRALLHEAGFRHVRYDPFSRALAAPGRDTANALFVRNPDTVRQRLASARPVSVYGERV